MRRALSTPDTTVSRKAEADDRTLLEVKDLSVAFEVEGRWLTAVRSVDLELNRGETLAIVGESGSGKSATVAGIVGLLPRNGRVTASRIALNGKPFDPVSSDMSSIRGREIGFVFQDPQSSLNPVLTIRRQLTEQLFRHYRMSKDEAIRRATNLLEKVGLPNPSRAMKSYPFEFSGGMRQRIALAMALSCSPSLVVADEPTTALDVTVQAQILDLLKELQEDLDIGIIFITHDLSVAALVADRIAVMYAGQVVEVGPTRALSSNPIIRTPRAYGYRCRVLTTLRFRKASAEPHLIWKQFQTDAVSRRRCDSFVSEVCSQVQVLDSVDSNHRVRCCRWEELAILPVSEFTNMNSQNDELVQAGAPIIALEDISVTYRSRRLGRRSDPIVAVDGVSLEVERGRSIGIVGESGSGKSTLAKAMVRIVRPSSGRIVLLGRDITDLTEKDIRPLRRHVQMVFQDPYSSLNPRRTVRHTLLEPLAIHRIASGEAAEQRLVDALEAVGLGHTHASRYPHEFSGGQRQRIAIARALMPEPDLIICDEPVSSLDVSIQAQIPSIVERPARGTGHCVRVHRTRSGCGRIDHRGSSGHVCGDSG